MENWLKCVMPQDGHSSLFAIEQAHRVPLLLLPLGAPHCSILLKLLHYLDKETYFILLALWVR